ncbi:tetratricopeptide repeat protein [Leptospira sp. GIMC2001]|uniref:tetratricopeptide repeat protein n=1 Tax=Leptospira sp. GIMC2001 TaxID=1513297 RepID=UPI002349B169|nr:hypothetical protein [Leptospira sp. GIMC2001]WCL49489.1 hypothetical protein O4O04_19705 [Leptospira sp. GIMC2001]
MNYLFSILKKMHGAKRLKKPKSSDGNSMGNVFTTIKRSLVKSSSIFSILFLISLLFSPILLYPAPSSYSYDELLDQAVAKLKAYDYGRALDKLTLARDKQVPLDYRFYYILGETYYRMGKFTEANHEFKKSLELEPGQIELLLKLSVFHETDRRPQYSLEILKSYFKFVPDNKNQIYRSAILARQVGENEFAIQQWELLEGDKNYEKEIGAIREDIQRLITLKNWNQAIEQSRKFLLYFPRDPLLHEYLILALRASDHKDLEKAIVDSNAIFYNNANFSIRYGIYLQEKERMLEALAAFRRAYTIILRESNDRQLSEVSFLIRQTYHFLNREHDARALAELQKILKSKDAEKEKRLLQATITYPKNREILVYAIYFLDQRILESNTKEDFDPSVESALISKIKNLNQQLKDRDLENEETELIRVIGPFTQEKN